MWLTPRSAPRRRKLTASMPSASRTPRAASTISSRSSFLGRPRLSVDVVEVIGLYIHRKSYTGQKRPRHAHRDPACNRPRRRLLAVPRAPGRPVLERVRPVRLHDPGTPDRRVLLRLAPSEHEPDV